MCYLTYMAQAFLQPNNIAGELLLFSAHFVSKIQENLFENKGVDSEEGGDDDE